MESARARQPRVGPARPRARQALPIAAAGGLAAAALWLLAPFAAHLLPGHTAAHPIASQPTPQPTPQAAPPATSSPPPAPAPAPAAAAAPAATPPLRLVAGGILAATTAAEESAMHAGMPLAIDTPARAAIAGSAVIPPQQPPLLSPTPPPRPPLPLQTELIGVPSAAPVPTPAAAPAETAAPVHPAAAAGHG